MGVIEERAFILKISKRTDSGPPEIGDLEILKKILKFCIKFSDIFDDKIEIVRKLTYYKEGWYFTLLLPI